MIIRNLRWGVLAVLLAACSSGRNEAIKPESPSEAEAVKPAARDSGVVSPEHHRETYTPPESPPRKGEVPRGRCGPDEMECCGACINKSEKRCPENIHCPAALPER